PCFPAADGIRAFPVTGVQTCALQIFHRFLHRLEDQNLSLRDYFQATGMSQEQFLADLEAQADRSLRARILLDAIIADAELEVDRSEERRGGEGGGDAGRQMQT